MPSDYEKAHADYRALVKAAATGDKKAHAEKAQAMNEIRKIERDSARAGTVLSAEYKGERLVVNTTQAESKRSLQEEYVRKFDGEKKVRIDGKETTLRDYHKKRLLGK
jgi:hypothetical protein